MADSRGSDYIENTIDDTDGECGSDCVDIVLNDDQIEVLCVLKCFQNEWSVWDEEFKDLLQTYSDWKAKLLENLRRLGNHKKDISRNNMDHDSIQKRCKVQSVYGGIVGLAGVLATPISGGLSLALTVGSTASLIHGGFTEYCSWKHLNSTKKETISEAEQLEQEITDYYNVIGLVITKLGNMVQQAYQIIRNTDAIGSNDGQCRFRLKGTRIPLKIALEIISNGEKTQTTTKTAKLVDTKNQSAAPAKDVTKSATGLISESVSILRSAVTVKKITQTTQKTAQLAGQTVKSASDAAGIAKSAPIASATSTSKVAGQLAENTNTGLKISAVEEASATCISKLGVAVGAVGLGVDLIRMGTHKEPAKTKEEIDIQAFCDDVENCVSERDHFINETREVHAKLKKIIEDISS